MKKKEQVSVMFRLANASVMQGSVSITDALIWFWLGRNSWSSERGSTTCPNTHHPKAQLSPSSHPPLKACFPHHSASLETPTHSKQSTHWLWSPASQGTEWTHSLNSFPNLGDLFMHLCTWQTHKEWYLHNSGCLKKQWINTTSSTLSSHFKMISSHVHI